jgi:hypothetical protein
LKVGRQVAHQRGDLRRRAVGGLSLRVCRAVSTIQVGNSSCAGAVACARQAIPIRLLCGCACTNASRHSHTQGRWLYLLKGSTIRNARYGRLAQALQALCSS